MCPTEHRTSNLHFYVLAQNLQSSFHQLPWINIPLLRRIENSYDNLKHYTQSVLSSSVLTTSHNDLTPVSNPSSQHMTQFFHSRPRICSELSILLQLLPLSVNCLNKIEALHTSPSYSMPISKTIHAFGLARSSRNLILQDLADYRYHNPRFCATLKSNFNTAHNLAL